MTSQQEQGDAGMRQQIKYLEKTLEAAVKNIDNLEKDVATITRVNDRIEIMQSQIKDSFGKMEDMMSKFIGVVQEQNEKIDKSVAAQNEIIDNFVNSDARATSKKDFVVSVIQAVGTILFTLATLWVTNVI